MDIVSKKTRSRMMAGIKGKNTRPEIYIRSELHKRGFRFRIHRAGLPGKPDVVLRRYRAVIFVQGCFWHGHGCHIFKWPSTREEFWKNKIYGNCIRDIENFAKLKKAGWRIAIIWECEIRASVKKHTPLLDELDKWLENSDTIEFRKSGNILDKEERAVD